TDAGHGQQRQRHLQLRRRVGAGGGQGDPGRHARAELRHRPRRAGHRDPGHAQSGLAGAGLEPAGNGAGLEQRAHGVQRRPLQHRAGRPGAGRHRRAQHRIAVCRARFRSARGAVEVHLRQRNEEGARALCAPERHRRHRSLAQRDHPGRHPRRAGKLPAHRADLRRGLAVGHVGGRVPDPVRQGRKGLGRSGKGVRRTEQDAQRRHVPLHAAGKRQRGAGDHPAAALPGPDPAVAGPHRQRRWRRAAVFLRVEVHQGQGSGRPPVGSVRWAWQQQRLQR
ncbi:hypothetical protein XPR_4016, partial [Xanthomonas arboricola pv. pruni MAFF 301420]